MATREPGPPVEVERHEQPVEDPRGSWWFKLDRAQKHLEEIKDCSVRYSETRPYTARREVEGYGDREFIVRAFLNDLPNFTLAAIFGDFFYNVRSALDHIAVALAPSDRHDKASFPIFTEDPESMDKGSLRRRSFEKSVRGMTEDALTAIKRLQPYALRPEHPELDHLAVVDSFAQADKHRELVAFAQYMLDPTTTLVGADGTILYCQRRTATYANGGIVAHFCLDEPIDESQVQVQVEGAIEIGLKRINARGDFVLPGTLSALLDYVRESVIPPLDALL